MQFIEVSDLGVRAAVYRLTPREKGPDFLLFPMIHAGTREYYAEVARRLEQCDLLFVEGQSSRRVAYLAWSYKVLAKIKRLDLVTQHTLDLAPFRDKIVNTDLSASEFDRHWQRVPLSLRLLLWIALPLYVAYVYVYGTRRFLARHLDLDDLPSRREVLANSEDILAFDDVMMRRRDVHLMRHVAHALTAASHDGITQIGILWGAEHMRAVTRFLMRRHRYRVKSAEWITVFTL